MKRILETYLQRFTAQKSGGLRVPADLGQNLHEKSIWSMSIEKSNLPSESLIFFSIFDFSVLLRQAKTQSQNKHLKSKNVKNHYQEIVRKIERKNI